MPFLTQVFGLVFRAAWEFCIQSAILAHDAPIGGISDFPARLSSSAASATLRKEIPVPADTSRPRRASGLNACEFAPACSPDCGESCESSHQPLTPLGSTSFRGPNASPYRLERGRVSAGWAYAALPATTFRSPLNLGSRHKRPSSPAVALFASAQAGSPKGFKTLQQNRSHFPITEKDVPSKKDRIVRFQHTTWRIP